MINFVIFNAEFIKRKILQHHAPVFNTIQIQIDFLITDVTFSEEKVVFIDNFCSNTLKKSYCSDVYSSLNKTFTIIEINFEIFRKIAH